MFFKLVIAIFLSFTTLFALSFEAIDAKYIAGQIYETEVSHDGETIYAANYNGLNVLNSELQEVYKLDLLYPVRKIINDTDRKLLFLANDHSGVSIVDVMDEQEPKLLASFKTGSQCRSIAYRKPWNQIIAIDDVSGLNLLDISQKNSPKLLQNFAFLSPIVAFTMDERQESIFLGLESGDILKVGVSGTGFEDVTILGKVAGVKSLVYKSGYLNVLSDNTLFTYQLSQSNQLIQHSSLNLDMPVELKLYGEYILISSTSYIAIVNNSNMSSPTIESYYNSSDRLYHTCVDSVRNRLFLSYWDNGLEVLDIRNDDILTIEINPCISKNVYAKNPRTGGWASFYSDCDIPTGWESTEVVPPQLIRQLQTVITPEQIEALDNGWHLLGTGVSIENLKTFQSAKALWTFKDGEWKSFSPNQKSLHSMQNAGFETLKKVEALQGIWVEK
jgi:hypothetical protein